MKRSGSFFGIQIALILGSSLTLFWSVAFYELHRSQAAHLREAEVRTVIQAQVFAEYSRSTIKRINEFLLNTRSEWNGDWQAFSTHIKRAQENIDDIVFQVAVIDRDGLLAFSNLAKPADRTDLSEREHFRVHKEAEGADRLFISKPLKGKVSGKWSIQLTRPILDAGRFNGVLVVSVSPDQFAAFAEKLGVSRNNVMTIVRKTGEIMSRYPRDEKGLGVILSDRPFLGSDAPLSGNYRQLSKVDERDRIWGFSTLPEYGMSFVMGEAVTDVLAPFKSHRRDVLLVASAVSVMASILLLLLFRSLNAVNQVKQQLAEIFALSPDGFVSFDARHRVSYVSPAFLEMTDFTEKNLIGLDEEAFSTRLAQRCNTQARFPGIVVLRALQKVGSGRTAEFSAADNPQRTSRRQLIELSGQGQRVLEVGLRISETADVAQILYFRDVTRETEVDRLKSEFLSTAAHELRTPMASIYGFTELLLNQEFELTDRRDFLETIFKQSELMVSIINELLDLARIEARRGKDFVMTNLVACELTHEIIADFKIPAGRKSPQELPSTPPCMVRGDRKKLTQAISNVLSNAYKYSPSGGAVSIDFIDPTTSAIREDRYGTTPLFGIRICDHGIGMTSEQLERVCERFYRADSSGKIPGTGLGMSIVKEIIELHSGSLQIDSEIGIGTTVTLWLPTATADSDSAATTRTEPAHD
jgi:signal transduction histidine kinase